MARPSKATSPQQPGVLAEIRIPVNQSLCLRDPEESVLGRTLITHSISLIDEIGFEEFTFKKLAKKIRSTEASMYRYFESKHKLLGYLLSWYWNWLSYRIDLNTMGTADPLKKLKVFLQVLAESGHDDPATVHIDEAALHRIVVTEGPKAYHFHFRLAKERDAFFEAFNNLVSKVAQLIKQANPRHKHPRAVAISIIHVGKRQLFYGMHYPAATELKIKKDDTKELIDFLERMTDAMVKD